MSDQTTVDDLLEKCKGAFQACVVAGTDKDGNMVIQSSVANVPFMHWMLNKATFELGLFEKQNVASENEKTPESEVDPEVS